MHHKVPKMYKDFDLCDPEKKLHEIFWMMQYFILIKQMLGPSQRLNNRIYICNTKDVSHVSKPNPSL